MKGALMQCNAKDFTNAVTIAKAGCAKRSALPVLECVHIDELGTVTGQDMEKTVETTIANSVGMLPAPVCIPHKTLLPALKSFGKDMVTLTMPETHTLTITNGSRSTTVKGYVAADFPLVVHASAADSVSLAVDGAAWADAWSKVSPCYSGDLTRQVLTGVLVSVTDGKLSMVATDSYRMTIAERCTSSVVDLPAVVLPGAALETVAKALKAKGEHSVAIMADGTRTTLSVLPEGVTVTVRDIASNYPNYRQFLPDPADTVSVKVDRETFAGAVDAATIKNGKNAPMVLTFSGNDLAPKILNASMTVQDIGQASAQTEYCGEIDLRIGFNPGYLSDGLKVCNGSEDLKLVFGTAYRDSVQANGQEEDKGKASPLRPMQILDGIDHYLIMPIWLGD